jgi:hypothetical protein
MAHLKVEQVEGDSCGKSCGKRVKEDGNYDLETYPSHHMHNLWRPGDCISNAVAMDRRFISDHTRNTNANGLPRTQATITVSLQPLFLVKFVFLSQTKAINSR